MAERIDRRGFIAGAGASLAATGMTAQSYARVLGANDRIQMGIVGPGGRGTYLLNTFGKFP